MWWLFMRCGFDLWVGKISWRRKWQPIPISLSGKSYGQRNLVGYSSWVARVRQDLATKAPPSSLVVEHRRTGFSSCGPWAELHQDMWNRPRSGIEPMFPCIGRQILIHSCHPRSPFLLTCHFSKNVLLFAKMLHKTGF